jgi:hypothetical protein
VKDVDAVIGVELDTVIVGPEKQLFMFPADIVTESSDLFPQPKPALMRQ